MTIIAGTVVTWNELRACDPDYFCVLDEEYERAHRFTAVEAVKIIVQWFREQRLDRITNREAMKQRLRSSLYLMALEAIIDDEVS